MFRARLSPGFEYNASQTLPHRPAAQGPRLLSHCPLLVLSRGENDETVHDTHRLTNVDSWSFSSTLDRKEKRPAIPCHKPTTIRLSNDEWRPPTAKICPGPMSPGKNHKPARLY